MMMKNKFRWLLLVLFISDQWTGSRAFVGGAFKKVQKDFQALTRRVTARHILVSNEEVAMALKRKIRDECIDKNEFVVDVFEEAAKKYSQDETTKTRGGLLGELVAQGYCTSAVLDHACFQVPLGQLEGPLKSEFGYHLLLVTERTNCPKLDGEFTKLYQQSSNEVFGALGPSENTGRINFSDFLIDQTKFWVLVFFAGGLVAELAEKIAAPVIF